ncbi:MAG: GxxExxY protein [Pirellula sp.]
MPLHCSIPIAPITNEAFKQIDQIVMKCAFATHNKLGKLCEERVYEHDLFARLQAEGIGNIFSQVPLTVSFRDFQKSYRLDLVVNGMTYELKAVDSIAVAHEAQVFNYAALLNINRIKLINFGGNVVDGQLRATPFADINRFGVSVDRKHWRPLSEKCVALADDAEQCFHHWGGFLDSKLYDEALIHFCGGEHRCLHRMPVRRDGLELGHHDVHLHSKDTAFVVTSFGDDTGGYESHLGRLLETLPIRAWQWINIHHAKMQLTTIQK